MLQSLLSSAKTLVSVTWTARPRNHARRAGGYQAAAALVTPDQQPKQSSGVLPVPMLSKSVTGSPAVAIGVEGANSGSFGWIGSG